MAWNHLLLGLLITLGMSAGPVSAETLRLCFENKDARPWRTAEGDGLDFTLLREVAQKLELQVEFQPLPWKRCLAMVQANEVDGAFSVSYSQGREKVAAFPGGAKLDDNRRMHIASYLLVKKKGAPLQWDGKQIHKQDGPIGFQLGYSVGDHLKGLKVPVQELNLPAVDIVRKVISGQLAGAAVFGSDLEPLSKGPLGEQFEVLQPAIVAKPYYLVLSHAFVKANPQRAEQIWNMVETVRKKNGPN